jgi:crotonobetainyl-CoA:carnitine CoA-transferase CaiB-like acyl-CoA transferase
MGCAVRTLVEPDTTRRRSSLVAVAHVLTPPDREYPIGQRGAMGDRYGGMALAFGMSAALRRRDLTGRGSTVDASLLGTALWMLSCDVLSALTGGQPPALPDRVAGPNPLMGTFRTKDARHIQLVSLQPDRHWAGFRQLIGRAELIDDPRFVDITARGQNREACLSELDAEFASRTCAEWLTLLEGLDAPSAPVQAIEELITDPEVLANNYIGDVVQEDGSSYRLPAVPVQLDEEPPPLRRAPERGEHTEELLLELGYSWEQISELREAGALA